MTFGEYFKQKRIKLGKTLREFCRDNKLDPGNISKLERGRVQAPINETKLLMYANYLNLSPGELEVFNDLAAISAGRIPPDLTERELAGRLPLIFSIGRDRRITETDLMALVELVRKSEEGYEAKG